MKPKMYEVNHRALGFYMMSTPSHHTYFKKKFMTQKPKYEIDQTVYLKDKQVIIYGIKRLLDGTIAYNLEGYPNELFTEGKLSLTPLDNKKYYILYRSADGLEMTEQLKVCHEVAQRLRRTTTSGGSRLYNYTREDLSDDCKTSTYIYDEVI